MSPFESDIPIRPRLFYSGGFSLIEVMVTIVIMSFGLLGLAGMMFSSLNAGQVSMSRSVAVNLANEMGDRIRANWKAIKVNSFDDVETTDYASATTACTTTCVTGTCSAADEATLDICLWKKQVGKQLPAGTASIEVDSTNVGCAEANKVCSFTISINWNEQAYRSTATDDRLYEKPTTSYSVTVQP